MALDVEEKIKTCERCVRRKAKTERHATLVNIATSRPLELVCDSEGRADSELVIVESLAMSEEAIPSDFLNDDAFLGFNTLPGMSQHDWACEQRNDPAVN